MRARLSIFITIALMALVTGCLVREVSQNLYLDADGVSWVVLETGVQSSAESSVDREAEEGAYLARARAGEHGMAAALRLLGAGRVDSRILRDRRPFTLLTEARFAGPERIVRNLLDALGIPGRVEAYQDGESRILRVTCYPEEHDEQGGEEALFELIDEEHVYRVWLPEGKFTDAVGFRLERDETVAVLDPDSAARDEQTGSVFFSLTWTAEAE